MSEGSTDTLSPGAPGSPSANATYRMPAINVECPLLESLQKKWKATGCAPASINKRMGVLHRAFRLACKAGRITSMPPFPERLSEESAIRKGFIEPEDFARFLDALPDDGLRDFVAYLGATGFAAR